jgi:hypothetical protein
MRRGRKSISQTPAPKKDRVKGSKINPKGSAASETSASVIKLSDSIIETLENKKEEYNKKHPNKKVTLATLKAVMRRGMGAYSTSHRPTISGGAPNSRQAWGFARVNKFLLKKAGTKVKAAYVQDDDLMAKGGEILDYFIHWTNKDGLENILYENELNEESSLTNSLSLPFDRENNMPFGIKLKSSIKSKLDKVGDVVGVTELEQKFEYRTNEPIKIDEYFDGFIVRNNTNKSRLEKFLDDSFGFWNNEMLTKYYKSHNGYNISVANMKYEDGGLIAPNGNKSNLTPEQYKLVRTPQFKEWFGDWENDPENASKVVDDNGEPLMVYHGTTSDFNIFNIGKTGGIFFTNRKKSAERFSEGDLKREGDTSKVLECFLNIKKPFIKGVTIDKELENEYWEEYFSQRPYINKKSQQNILNQKDKFHNELVPFGIVNEDAKKHILSKNYDGITFLADNLSRTFVVFNSTQVKLADGSNTTFDMNNPDIRFEDGGEMGQDIVCHNCAWEWNTDDSDSADKYVCHHCGFDNSEYYMAKKGINLPVGKLAKGMTLSQVAAVHGLKAKDIMKELVLGIKTEMEHTDKKEYARAIALDHLYEDPRYYTKLKKMENITMKRGGQINPDDKNIKREAVQNSGATGGLLVGNRHSEGGIKAINKSSGTPLEMEGGEVVITRDAVSDETKREFEGEMLTNRQILSRINQSGGGIAFADGGEVPEKCSCSGKSYKYGGKVMKDIDIATYINGDNKARRNILENYYNSIEEAIGFEEGGVLSGLEDLSDCARSFFVDLKNSGKQFLDFSKDKKSEIKELEDHDLVYFTNSSSMGCLTAFLTQKGKKLMSEVPAHLFKKGGMTDCGCGCGSYKDGGDLDSEKKYFKGVDYDYENQFLVNKAIEELLDNKEASDLSVEEKNFLTYYSGYGGLEKYGASGEGLLYEYFTPSLIAQKMWGLAYKHGFEGGLVLEPSCGIGEFIKYAPEQNMVSGYEVNETSAKICRILYPYAKIKTEPFEKIFIKNNYTIKNDLKGITKYNLVIGNPPYGRMGGIYAGMGEKQYAKANNYIDYFILRGLDLLQSGGLLVYVIGVEVAAGGTPFLQQGITENKKLISQRADLVDAYRLPNGVFERTDVLTDIVVFKKK